MENTKNHPTDTIELFKKCGTCSYTFAHILNRAFGHPQAEAERAVELMAGGVMNQGHQCGMLWGSALAAGAEAYRRFEDPDDATAVAVTTTQHIIESFEKRTNTVNCREIIGIDLSKTLGLLKFIVKSMLQGEKNNPCFHLADQWAPESILSAEEGLSEGPVELTRKPLSCASEVVRKMGASQEEQVMVAGFAGGLGLSGNACGALSAAIWMKTLAWCKANPGKTPPYFNNPAARKIMQAFLKATDGEMRCDAITGRRFATVDEHSEFIENGGCKNLIQVLVETALHKSN
ncbi:MAG: C-GCAxxG-C-C family protein [Saprospiraceae bacterium]|nr:C_GCAxxG_C_C family protein [Saprospiraceae bacterium]